jgi:hypothetical protein
VHDVLSTAGKRVEAEAALAALATTITDENMAAGVLRQSPPAVSAPADHPAAETVAEENAAACISKVCRDNQTSSALLCMTIHVHILCTASCKGLNRRDRLASMFA